MKIRNLLRAMVAAYTLAAASQASAAILQVSSTGLLTGAKGVNVGGTLYDVTFGEGSCVSLFNGCTDASFTFNRTNADLASQALFEQVFLDTPLGNFDSDPTKTFGCYKMLACSTLIPYIGKWAGNHSGGINYSANNEYGYTDWSVAATYFNDNVASNRNGGVNYGIFELARVDPEVPEPGSIALFCLAMAALAFNRRRWVQTASYRAV